MTQFTAAQVMDALEAVVKGKENYIDPAANQIGTSCKYEKDGKPSCIVGQTLALLGVGVYTLTEMDECSDPVIDSYATGVLRDNGYHVEKAALTILREAQSVQDRGLTWGEALAEAHRWYERGIA